MVLVACELGGSAIFWNLEFQAVGEAFLSVDLTLDWNDTQSEAFNS